MAKHNAEQFPLFKERDYVFVIGYIDAYGAIHHRGLTLDDEPCHATYWPMQAHKLWRFIISDWRLSNSPLSKDNLTKEEAEDVLAHIRKHFRPPEWYLKGEAWDAAGRPRGKAYERFLKKYEKSLDKKTKPKA